MGWRKKQEASDPFEARSKALADQIRKLEKQIQDLAESPEPPSPRKPSNPAPTPLTAPAAKAQPVTASKPSQPTTSRHPPAATPLPKPPPPTPPPTTIGSPLADTRVNPHGVRKFDLAALWSRLQNHFRGPNANNPRMVQYLAAGSVHGLRPLRYERRVARNRFIGLFVLLVLILFGLAKVYFPSG
jgi:cell division protein FtsB